MMGMEGLDQGSAMLFALVILLGVNQLIQRAPRSSRVVLALLAMVNACIGGVILAWGLPGFDQMPGVAILVGLLLCFHAVLLMRQQRALERGDPELAEIQARLEAHRARENRTQ